MQVAVVPSTDGSMKDLDIILMDNHRTDMSRDRNSSRRCNASVAHRA